MRVLLVGFTKLSRMPYVNIYLDALAGTGDEIHLLYWNRDGQGDASQTPAVHSYYEFDVRQDDEVARYTKLPNFLRYRRFARRLLSTDAFDVLIVLHTIPAALLGDELFWRYRGRFILDFRDLTLERHSLFRGLVGAIANRSAAVLVSSDAFRAFLPAHGRVHASPNLDVQLMEHRSARLHGDRSISPIRIRFWGLVRHATMNTAVIDQFGNDERFELHYHGSGGATLEDLKRHVIARGITNVHFHGSYLPHERYALARDTELLLNTYENDPNTIHAMGNKFYDGIALYLPQLCTEGSFMGNRAADSGVGLAADPLTSGYAELVYRYYEEIDWEAFQANCDRELSIVLAEMQGALGAIRHAVRVASGLRETGSES